MRNVLNVKSLVVGVLLASLLVYAMGAVPVLQNENFGRFTILSHFEHILIFDTATGQLWMQSVPENSTVGLEGSPDMEIAFFGPKLDLCGDPNSLMP